MARSSHPILCTLLTSLLLSCVAGCNATVGEGGASDGVGGAALVDQAGARRFRDLFAVFLVDEGRPATDAPHVAFLPGPASSAAAGATTLEEVHTSLLDVLPSELFDRGLDVPLSPVALDGEHDAASEAAGEVPSILIFPGYYEEFFAPPFRSAFDGDDGAYEALFHARLAAAGGELATDESFDIRGLKMREVPMAELFDLATLRAPSGKSIARLVSFVAPKGSGETVGDLAETSPVYLRRLAKFFEVMGTPDSFYILGYSRGVPMALDVAAAGYAEQQLRPWFTHLRGVISVSGTIYGATLADAALDRGTTLGKLTYAIEQVASDLRSCRADDSAFSRLNTIAHNGRAWAYWGTEMAKLLASGGPARPVEFEGGNGVDMLGSVRLIGEIVFNYMFDARQALFNDCHNVEQWKTGVRLVGNGLRMLSTEGRRAWFASHVLPPNIKYFAVASTMADPTGEGEAVSPLVHDPIAYGDTRSFDYDTLRGAYYLSYDLGAGPLNDGIMPVSGALFWPEVHHGLNPGQPPLQTENLAVLASHHWGPVMDRVFPQSDKSVNALPRLSLLKALASYVTSTE